MNRFVLIKQNTVFSVRKELNLYIQLDGLILAPRYFCFPLLSFHHCYIPIFILRLLLSEGKTDET